MGRLASELGFDRDVFAQYGSAPELAQYYHLQKRSLGPLRSVLDREWHEDKATRVNKSDIHRLIVELDFPVIYTTNYDEFIETAFEIHSRPFHKVVRAGDFQSAVDGNTQVVKFHGDFSDDASLVLTESSFFERLALDNPLDTKLKSDLLHRPVLFIGYNLGDLNMRYLLYKLYRAWQSSPDCPARPEGYIFLSRPNPIQQEILGGLGIQCLQSDEDDRTLALAHFLEALLAEKHR